eukprot:TRINITY_DN1624_c0_g2_i8.p2 TRINITY_DN1624_c0_g2~~TRINITY_DN1624_c0_g2_i8.p2  ORF type:complete len:194 (+),score=59.45 TRINITY_DN1624_c0_g2_i8:2619-3200(+)
MKNPNVTSLAAERVKLALLIQDAKESGELHKCEELMKQLKELEEKEKERLSQLGKNKARMSAVNKRNILENNRIMDQSRALKNNGDDGKPNPFRRRETRPEWTWLDKGNMVERKRAPEPTPEEPLSKKIKSQQQQQQQMSSLLDNFDINVDLDGMSSPVPKKTALLKPLTTPTKTNNTTTKTISFSEYKKQKS